MARGGTLAHDNPADPDDPATGSAKGQGENLAGGESAATAPTQWYAEKAAVRRRPEQVRLQRHQPRLGQLGPLHADDVEHDHQDRLRHRTRTALPITSCRYSPPGNFDGELAYPGADTLQVPAVTHASATADTVPSAAENAPPTAVSTDSEAPPTAAPADGGPSSPAEPAESSAPTGG